MLYGLLRFVYKVAAAERDLAPLYLAIGILGATVMPHNVYLHASIVQTRMIGKDLHSKQDAERGEQRVDLTVRSLSLKLCCLAEPLREQARLYV